MTQEQIFDFAEFIACARYGELEELQEMVKMFNLSISDMQKGYNEGSTALHYASANGHSGI